MKKILFTLGFALLTLIGNAQFNGTISGTVTDSLGNPVHGIAVFHFGSIRNLPSLTPGISFINRFDYTDASGNYSVNYGVGGTVSQDTILIAIADCSNNLHYTALGVDNSGWTNPINVNFDYSNICFPAGGCRVLSEEVIYAANNYKVGYFLPLYDSTVTPTYPIFQKSRNGVAYSNSNDVLKWGNPDTISANIGDYICYQYLSSCAPICYGTAPPPSLGCNANFFVDTVNSINFAGQVVIWENSSTDSGAAIVNYQWTFGDGATSNLQYPTHNYADTGIYQVCLTITSYSATDTCVDTYCDSIGFDSNGNLVYKANANGFTINVVDPASIGLEEVDKFESVDLFPNPSRGEATLRWKNGLSIDQVEVWSLSGKRLKQFAPSTNQVELAGLNSGVYLVRLQSAEASKTIRLIVK